MKKKLRYIEDRMKVSMICVAGHQKGENQDDREEEICEICE